MATRKKADGTTTAPDHKTLTPFDGRIVIGSSVRVHNAGDGLSKAMGVEPVELHTGDKVYVVLETEVGPITHDPVKETGQYIRIHHLKAGTGTIVDSELVKNVIDAQAKKIEEASGIYPLDFDSNGDSDQTTEED